MKKRTIIVINMLLIISLTLALGLTVTANTQSKEEPGTVAVVITSDDPAGMAKTVLMHMGVDVSAVSDEDAILKTDSLREYYGDLLTKNGIDTTGWQMIDIILKGQAIEEQASRPAMAAGETGTTGNTVNNEDYFNMVAKKLGIDPTGMTFEELTIAVKEAEVAYYEANALENKISNEDYLYSMAKKLGIDPTGMTIDELTIAVKEAEVAYYEANTPKMSDEEAKALMEKQIAEKMRNYEGTLPSDAGTLTPDTGTAGK